MKEYVGKRSPITVERWVSHYGWTREEAERMATEPPVSEARVFVRVEEDGIKDFFELGHDCYHSPSGVEWAYAGSGPADLARSILKDVLGHVPKCYQTFKREVVAALPRDSFTLAEADVRDWLDRQASDTLEPWDDNPMNNMVENAMTQMGDIR